MPGFMKKMGLIQYFEQYGTQIKVEKETSICNPMLSDTYIYYLVKGIASLTSITSEGEEKDFLYFSQESLLGFAPALMRHYRKMRGEPVRKLDTEENTPFGIDTKTDCSFYRLDERTFERLLEEDPQFQSYVIEAVTLNYVTLVKKFYSAQEESASRRFSKWLLEFSSLEDRRRIVPNGFTYAEIAKYLGMHPVTVYKLAAKLKKEGVLIKEKGHIVILDEDGLKAML